MDVENLAKELILKNMTPEQQMAVLESVRQSVANAKEVQKKKIGENVDLVVQALKKIEADIRDRFDAVGNTIEKRVASIQDGRDGANGKDGRDGKDGKSGRDGLKGDRGVDGQAGRDGVDGVDGISVVNANIDFDGSLVITLSDGRELNVGEVVSADVAEKIKVISTMSTNAAIAIKDEGSSITSSVKTINFVGATVTATNSGDDVTVNVSAGTGTVTSVGVSGGTTGLTTTGSPITTTGTITLGGTLAVASGGTGTATPSLVAGTNITSITGTWPNQTINASGGAGTVTSVAALTLGTSGTDLSSTVANSTTTPVITLNVPTASATNRGALSSADWTTFNNKGSGTVTSVTATSPVASSGGATPAISLSSGYGDTLNPYASKTANFVLAAPNGSAGVPTFRAVVAADIPTLNQNTTGSAATVTTTINSGVVATTQTAGDNSTKVATTAYVNAITGTSGITGFKNRIINGAMVIDQRNAGASQTFTAAAALAYAVDRWYGYCTGANVTGQQVAGSTTPTNTQFRYKFTGAASVTAVGFGQRIEQKNSYDLAGSTCTLSADLAISATLTTVTWTAYYATTTADTFGSLASPTVTQIATGTFTVTSTVTNFTTNISVPAAATTGIQILFTVGALTAGLTWTIGNVQFEKGSTATSFDYRPYGGELQLAQRYYWKTFAVDTAPANNVSAGNQTFPVNVANFAAGIRYPISMRATPTVTKYNPYAANSSFRVSASASDVAVTISANSSGGFEGWNLTLAAPSSIQGHITADSEL